MGNTISSSTQSNFTRCVAYPSLVPFYTRGNNFAQGYLSMDYVNNFSSDCKGKHAISLDSNKKQGSFQYRHVGGFENASSPDTLFQTLSLIRKAVEKSDFGMLSYFILTFATAGGTGSGLTARLLECLRELYPKIFLIAIPIWPFWSAGDTCTAAYNTALCMSWLQMYADMILIMENEALEHDHSIDVKFTPAVKPLQTKSSIRYTSGTEKGQIEMQRPRAVNFFHDINSRISITLMHLLGGKLSYFASENTTTPTRTSDPQLGFEYAENILRLLRVVCPMPSLKLVSPVCSYISTANQIQLSSISNEASSFSIISDGLLKKLVHRRESVNPSVKDSRLKYTGKMDQKNEPAPLSALTLSAQINFLSLSNPVEKRNFLGNFQRKLETMLRPIWNPSESICSKTFYPYIPDIQVLIITTSFNVCRIKLETTCLEAEAHNYGRRDKAQVKNDVNALMLIQWESLQQSLFIKF
ncbi:hypothetical protein IE077_000637 [Cardiosporidium cionae]|uniref:Tubulin/FtsZ GTPase domain-containing protein n=1 Tax=Cardiosporidium cionae TaxID=476202 RepID=A0ABQ7JE92_9APIC|nr:hypothetical protein IE077_000637 [Cardiosporidium cionae]|eukprot:KAF8822338.1 hypothetical protein IE077_000637 [Cardiosporidium cionae]